jgi:hypothetical protein
MSINKTLNSHRSNNNTMSSQNNILKGTTSYQNSGSQPDTNEKKPQYRRAISLNGYYTLQEKETSEQKPTLEVSPINHVLIPISETSTPVIHREIKNGRQRCRWNLIFNLLVWIICPLPLWLPFVSNQLAIYLLPSIQSSFVLIWLIISLLAGRNAWILYRLG